MVHFIVILFCTGSTVKNFSEFTPPICKYTNLAQNKSRIAHLSLAILHFYTNGKWTSRQNWQLYPTALETALRKQTSHSMQ